MTKKTILLGSISLVLLVGIFGSYWKATSIPNKIYAYIHDVDLSLYMHRGVSVVQTSSPEPKFEDKIAAVDKRFEKGERLVALAQYYHLLEEDPSNMELLLRIGIIYLQEQAYDEAQEKLALVYHFKTSIFYLDAAWFMALLQAEYGNWEESKQLLEEVVQERGNYHLQARALLERMQNA